jgi:hypothetical protein
MSGRLYLLVVSLVAAGSVVLLWFSDVPLGVPGEWTWERISYDRNDLPGNLVGPVVALGSAALYAVFCGMAGRRIPRSRRLILGGWLLLLVLAASGLLFALQAAPPVGHDLARLPVVLYDPAASGYFTIARYDARGQPIDTAEFLASYEARMREGDVLHVGTHPPGLILAQRGLIALCRRSPGLTRGLRAVTPATVDESFDMLDRQARIGPVLTDSDRAALWLGVLLVQLTAAATIVPLYLLIRRYRSRAESWRAACLWPLVPALAVFVPKSDALFPFLGTLFLWLWLEGCSRPSALRALLAGVVLWVGMSMSLAMLPVAALGAVLAAWEWRTAPVIGSQVARGRGLMLAIIAAAAGFFGLVAAVWVQYDMNLLNVWLWNYRNHAAFYDQYDRTWWKWLLVNPAELVLAAGPPLALAALAAGWCSLRGLADRRAAGAAPARRFAAGPVLGCLLIWGLVWVWGKNMGEAARLWLVFQPWLVWLAAGTFSDGAARVGDAGGTRWLWTLAAQAIVCVASVTRVSGFQYLPERPVDPPVERAPTAATDDRADRDARAVGASAAG